MHLNSCFYLYKYRFSQFFSFSFITKILRKSRKQASLKWGQRGINPSVPSLTLAVLNEHFWRHWGPLLPREVNRIETDTHIPSGPITRLKVGMKGSTMALRGHGEIKEGQKKGCVGSSFRVCACFAPLEHHSGP